VLVVVLVLVLDNESGSKASRTRTSTSTSTKQKNVLIRNYAGLAQFLYRFDWPVAASGDARVKLLRTCAKPQRWIPML